MMELLQLITVILLAGIFVSIKGISTKISQQTRSMGACFEQIDTRLADMEQRLRDNFETDEERQRQEDMTPPTLLNQ